MYENDQGASGGQRYPLKIFYENEQPADSSTRSRGRGGGRGRGGRGNRGRGGEFRSRSHSRPRQERTDTSISNDQNNNRNGAPQHFQRGRPFNGRGAPRGDPLGMSRGAPPGGRGRGENYQVHNVPRNEPREGNGGVRVDEPVKARPPPFFSRDKLIRLSKSQDFDDVLLEISHSRSGFDDVLRKKPDPKLVHHLLQLLANVSISTKVNIRREIMHRVEETFLHNLSELLSEVSMREGSTSMIWNATEELEQFLKNILQLLTVIITTLPSSLAKCKNVMRAVKDVQDEFDIVNVEKELCDVEEVLQREKQAKQTSKDNESNAVPKQPKTRQFGPTQPLEPPDSFRNILIFPTLNDLSTETKPFLRANKAEGKYDSLETYLDVQFRLLREDYIQPLRKGISEYRSCIRDNIPVKKLRDVKLYHSVQIVRPVCSGAGISYILQFDMKYLKHTNWAASRRLLFGSLLCLSKDNFQTVIYAVVTDRSEKDLQEGNIQVHFDNMADGSAFGPNDTFVMAESSAYFEAYRYILEGLLEVKDSIPFQRYIIDCEDTIRPPKYLLGKVPHYNFSCLLDDPEEDLPPVPVLNTLRWPSSADLGFDYSQYEAIKRALTKELAIIQGPPGTGKTFVGLKITKLLLKNSQFWQKGGPSPILVVCYTNHALDQFLEAIEDFCDGKIVRIGGRCKSEQLKPYILRNVKQQRKDNRERSFRLMQKERDCLAQLRQCEREITEVSADIKKATTRILPYDTLEEFMSENHKFGFQLLSHGASSPNIAKWLGFEEDIDISDAKVDASIVQIWEQEIIGNVNAMSEPEKIQIVQPWELDLKRRAELYKAWLAEVLENVQNTLNSAFEPQLIQKLKTTVERSEEKVLDVETMLTCITKLSSKIQIQMLFAGQVVNIQNLIQHWLKLTGKKAFRVEIRNALESLMNNDVDVNIQPEDGDDLEEDRELDEDDFLYDNRKKIDISDRRKINDRDWITELGNRKFEQKVKDIFSSAKQISHLEAEMYGNVAYLNDLQKRKELYAYWVRKYRAKLRETIIGFEKKYNESSQKMVEVRDMETIEILNEAEIVGMTTTGAAKYRRLFQSVRPKIIIVEEAAEVLESHIVTTLNEDCQHLILIGDHKQLRPSTAVYDLSKKFHMDVSLFERMVRNNVPYITLEEQHRMRPEISTLLKHKELYPQLRDHPSVSKYEGILGIDNDVQFIDHEEKEVTSTESTSYSNPHEAKYIASLCQYLLNQGYKPSQITVITPYMGQVFLLRREMPKTLFEGVRITAIDNYQGEENEIILLSLVRSNVVNDGKRNQIGFVGIENRICVSLSRAKKGLYVVGNFKLLGKCSTMWADMIDDMKKNDRVKKALTLRCQNHPDQFVNASNYKDFQKVASGGCLKPCGAILPCSHICPKNCHVTDREHKNATCTMPCEKVVCDDGHRCTLKCWQPCGKCKTYVEKTLPLCRHKASMPCHKDVYLWKCHVKCQAVLLCGHLCNRDCHTCTEEGHHENECKAKVSKLLDCKHTAEMLCYEDPDNYQCPEPCDAILDCKHKCSGKCSTCFAGRIHNGCRGTCKKLLPCGHECSFPCSEICLPCSKSCQVVCPHGAKCKRKCWEPCDTTCNQRCQYSCKHQKCDHDCSEKCPSEACNKLCLKSLGCGHQCRSLCGETCLCLICQKSNVGNDVLQIFDELSCFIQLPDCRCIIEVGRLDRHMKSDNFSRREALCRRCPHCSKPIRKIVKRYSNVLKETRANIAQKFRDVMGSDESRRKRSSSLRVEILKLKLEAPEMQKLMSQLDKPNNFDTLHTTDKKVECLKDQQRVSDEIARSVMSKSSFYKRMGDLVVVPDVIRNVIIEGKKFTTTQFWNEIDREICRLRLGIGIYRRMITTPLDNSSEVNVSRMFNKAFEVLGHRDLNSKKRRALQLMLDTIGDQSNIDPSIASALVSHLRNLGIREKTKTATSMEVPKYGDTRDANDVEKTEEASGVIGHWNGSDEYFESIEHASDSTGGVAITYEDPVGDTRREDSGAAKLGIAERINPGGIASNRRSGRLNVIDVTHEMEELSIVDVDKYENM